MYFKSAAECSELARFFGFDADPKRNALKKKGQIVDELHVDLRGNRISMLALARQIAAWLGCSGPRLLWVTEMGIWPSSENRHLYYRLRGSYHDHRSLADAPGHLFENYEEPDLITFLEIVLRSGWGGFLFGPPTCYVTISHDEWMLIGCQADSMAIIKDLGDLKLPYKNMSDER